MTGGAGSGSNSDRRSGGPHGTLRVAADDMVCDKAHSVEVQHRVARHSETDLRAIIGLRRQHDVFGEVGILKPAIGLTVGLERLGKVIGNAIPQMAGECYPISRLGCSATRWPVARMSGRPEPGYPYCRKKDCRPASQPTTTT